MKKGFVLMESIIVILAVTVSLLTIFVSYNKILSKLRTENKYDTTEYLYMTNWVKKFVGTTGTYNVIDMNANITNPNILEIKSNSNMYFKFLADAFNVKRAYILKNINNLKKDNLKYFDAYMIDYIKQLDIGNEELLIVEYEKPIIYSDTAYDCSNNKCDSKNNVLYETYISSLRWK